MSGIMFFNSNVGKANIDRNVVYNDKCKLIVQNRNFMEKPDVTECMNVLTNDRLFCTHNDEKNRYVINN